MKKNGVHGPLTAIKETNDKWVVSQNSGMIMRKSQKEKKPT
jgi:hypothetical protein